MPKARGGGKRRDRFTPPDFLEQMIEDELALWEGAD
jgi:hypothetical protein